MTFPTAYWQAWNSDAEFHAGTTLPPESRGRCYAALAFVFYGPFFVLADVAGRGLCIPSGRIEADEAPEEAARRETWEECGARIEEARLIGCYRLIACDNTQAEKLRWCPVYAAEAVAFEPIPLGSESRGVFLALQADMPQLYFTWDPLIAAVFDYAGQCRRSCR